jgi:CPA1 family monovalent cation:H+ antiporter
VARRAPGQTSPRLRVISNAVWDTAIFVLNVLAFVLIGEQIGPILARMTPEQEFAYASVAGAVVVTVILVRIAWVLPASAIRRVGFGTGSPHPDDLRQDRDLGLGAGFAVSWSGMRGLVTIATALALPEGGPGGGGFPYRDLIVLTAFCVVIGTLVVQGLTLRPILARLGLEDSDPVGREVGRARAEAYGAAVEALSDDRTEAADALRREFHAALAKAEAHEEGLAPEGLPTDAPRRRAIRAARDRLLTLRRSSRIGDDAYFVLEEELDWAELNATPRGEA